MQELHTERDFFDWLNRISALYGETMATWGQQVHDAVAGRIQPHQVLEATDAAVNRLVEALMSIGAWHDRTDDTPGGGAEVLHALDQLLGASAELLREARSHMATEGLRGLAAVAPRIAELRTLEADVEQATEQVRNKLESRFGNPGEPE